MGNLHSAATPHVALDVVEGKLIAESVKWQIGLPEKAVVRLYRRLLTYG